MMDPADDLPVELWLEILDRTLLSLPEEARPAARRSTLAFYATMYRNAGAPVPEWVRVGLERSGVAQE